MAAREALEYCKQSSMEDSGWSSEDWNAGKKSNSEEQVQAVSSGKKDAIGGWIPGHVCYALAENLSTFCQCPDTFGEIKIDGDGLTNLLEEISKQPNIQTVAWVLLGAFSQLYTENQEQRAQLSDFKQFQFCQKRISHKDGAEKIVVAGKVNIKKKPSNWLLKRLSFKKSQVQDNRKNGLRACRERSRSCLLSWKTEKLCSEKRAPGHSVGEGTPRELISQKSFYLAEQCRHSETSVTTSQVQMGLVTSIAHSRPCCHPDSSDFSCMQEARVVGLGSLLTRFQKKVWKSRHCAPKKAVHETVQVKPKVHWRHQQVGEARSIERQRKTTRSEQSQPKTKDVGATITGKATSLKSVQPSWVNLARPLPKSKASLKSPALPRTGSTPSISSTHSDPSTYSNHSGNAAVIKYEEKPSKSAFQNGSGSLCLKTLVPRAHVHLLKTPPKGPSRKSLFTSFNTVEKSRQKNPRSLCIQTQTSPDVLSSEKALELTQYKTKCESQSGFILQLKQLLSRGNIKLEALTVVIQHLLSEREEALKQHKTLSQELVNLRGELVAASTTCEKLEKARNELQTAYEAFVQKLNQQHQTDQTELESRLKEFYTGECEKLQNIYIEEAEKYKAQLQEQFDNLSAAHETSKLEIEASHSEKIELLKQAYETSLSEIKKSHEMEKKSLENLLSEKQSSLEKQISDLKSENDALNEKLKSEEQKRISREKANLKNPQIMYLEQELESLKAVLEIKNEKLHQQDVKLMKMEKLVDNNTALVDKLKRFQQENEELKARMDKHMAISRQLSTEQAVLQESLEKESKVNKRLSMENEELLWKLHNGDLCSPKRSPTSSAIPFQSPRNSGSFPSPNVSPR